MFYLVMQAENPFGTSVTFLLMMDRTWILRLLIGLLKRIISLPPSASKQSNTTTANSYTFPGSKKHFLFPHFPKLVSSLLPEYMGSPQSFLKERVFFPLIFPFFYLKMYTMCFAPVSLNCLTSCSSLNMP